MLNKKLLSQFACAAVILSPVVLTGCQMFGNSSEYNNNGMPYNHSRAAAAHHHTAGTAVTTPSGRTRNVSSNYRHSHSMRHSSSTVPVDAPSVHNASANTVDSSMNGSANYRGVQTKVPAAETVAPATNMVSPTVGQ